jgi:hypothetical protein
MNSYRGIDYIITTNPFGAFVAYIKLPKDHPWQEFMDDYDSIPLNVHGGVTFAKEVREPNRSFQQFTEGSWIGWDYAHLGDYIPLLSNSCGSIWDQESVLVDVKDAIDQLISAYVKLEES